MPRANASVPLALLAALSLVLVSYACVVSCWGAEAAIPPCHHHKSSCAPLLLTAEVAGNSVAVTNLASAVPVPVATPLNKRADTELEPVTSSSPPEPSSQTTAILRI